MSPIDCFSITASNHNTNDKVASNTATELIKSAEFVRPELSEYVEPNGLLADAQIFASQNEVAEQLPVPQKATGTPRWRPEYVSIWCLFEES